MKTSQEKITEDNKKIINNTIENIISAGNARMHIAHLLIVFAEVACEDKPREDNSGPGKNRPCGAV